MQTVVKKKFSIRLVREGRTASLNMSEGSTPENAIKNLLHLLYGEWPLYLDKTGVNVYDASLGEFQVKAEIL